MTASGSARAGAPAATADRRARRASAAGDATAGSRLPRTSRAGRDRGCRSRSTRARRDRRRDSRSPTRSRRYLRARPWASARRSSWIEITSGLDERSSRATSRWPTCVFSTTGSPAYCWTIDSEAGVEEADLEQHQKRHRPVDLVRQRVEHRRGEIEAERQLDQRLHGHRLAVLLADPLVRVAFDAVLRRARELASPC